MLLRGMLSSSENQTLDESKIARYGLEDAKRIHKGYEMGVITQNFTGNSAELLKIIKNNNLETTEGRYETSIRISKEVHDKIFRFATEINVSKIAVVRALLYKRKEELDLERTIPTTKISVCEWNLNHRSGFNPNSIMPDWIINSLLDDEKYDVIVLNECSNKVVNFEMERKRLEKTYYVFNTNNSQYDHNDVTIAIKKSRISVLSTRSFISNSLNNNPNHLEVNCMCLNTGKLFTIVGMRIRPVEDENERINQLQLVLNSLTTTNKVLIAGDYNNNRRTCTDNAWNLETIQKITTNKGFNLYTPEGSSFGRDVETSHPICFALDHFILKGISAEPTSIRYSRAFTKIDPSIYKWGTHFQTAYEWDKPENNIAPPYPDHALLEGTFLI